MARRAGAIAVGATETGVVTETGGSAWTRKHVDVADPAAPSAAGVYHTLGYASGVDIAGDHACVADNFMGLRVIDLTTYTEAGYYELPASALDVTVAGGGLSGQAARPPEAIFGPEPSREGWCYAFEQADVIGVGDAGRVPASAA